MVQWHTEKKLYEGFHFIKLAKYHKIMHCLQLKYFVYISKANLLFRHLWCRQEWVAADNQAHLQRSLPHLQHTGSLLRSLWHVAEFWVLSTAEAEGTSHISLEWLHMGEQTHTVHQICVTVRLFFLAPAPLRALPFSCPFPILFESRDTSSVSESVWPKGIWHHGSLRVGFLSCCSSFGQGWKLSGSVGGWMEFGHSY